MALRIAFATCDAQPSLHEAEGMLVSRLCERGVDASAQIWSDPAVDWSRFDLVVIRSTWDYFERADAFRAWLDDLEERGTAVQNPVSLVRWNMDKSYLLDLAEQGVRIPPTRFVQRGALQSLPAILEKHGWRDAVVKPLVSGNAHRTARVSVDGAAAHQGAFDALVAEVGALVQPFVPEVVTEGEWSLLFFGGAFSHAVLKKPAAGDYRVQAQFGGRDAHIEPPPALIEEAQRIVACAPEPLLYARVDGVRRGSAFLLMELEAIEPFLYFASAPEAVDRYLEAVLAVARREAERTPLPLA